MKDYSSLPGVLLCFFLFSFLFSSGQDSNPTQTPSIITQKSVVIKSPDSTENVSRGVDAIRMSQQEQKPFFQDKKLLKSIIQAEKSLLSARADQDSLESATHMKELDQLLTSFIGNFGTENFKRNYRTLWKMGRLKQIQGDTASALFFYELAHKHGRGMDAPKLSYDSLSAPTHNEWLPIDKYYDLLKIRRSIDTILKPQNVLVSLGPTVNANPFPDYAPFMHPHDSILFFTSRREKEDVMDPFSKTDENLYYSFRDFMDGEWVRAEKLPDIINSKFNEGSACLSPNGLTLYFTRCNDDETGFGDCDLYEATYDPTDDSWNDVHNLGAEVNTSYWDSHPNISEDGKYLYFASNRAGGYGATDIYVSEKNGEGKWGKAVNLGPMVNSSQDEVTPFFHRINKTLYFSSSGQVHSLGGFDIYRSRWMGEDWESPRNVGPLVNTRGNDYYFSIDGKADFIYYSRSEGQEDNHLEQDFDLYAFPMPMGARPEANSLLRGFLVDSVSGNPLTGTVMIIDLDENVEIAPKVINEEGYFEFDLIKDRKYQVYIFGNSFLTIKKEIELVSDTTFNILTENFNRSNKPIVFESLKFSSNSYKLKKSIKPKLDYLVRFLELYPQFDLVVEGHTDSDGDPNYNMQLSQQRAEIIADYIMGAGSFDEDRVTAQGFGDSRPVVPNDTKDNKEKNRRVEFKLILNKQIEGEILNPTEEELFFEEELEEADQEDPNADIDLLEDLKRQPIKKKEPPKP
ncbi:MAG: OmpA family protein [Bacteroidota bacterium]